MKEIVNVINKFNSFLVTAHINLEGDALGSELALASLLKRLGKKVYVVNSDKNPESYSFLPGVNQIRRKITKDMAFDCLIFVDCSDKQRAGNLFENIPPKVTMVNIDHHVSNTNFAKVNWVDGNYSSAGEMIYCLFKDFNIKFNQDEATLLYTAILTDTGSFKYPNTTSFTHEVASDLLKYGISANKIYSSIYETNSFSNLVLIKNILATLERYNKGKVASMELTPEMVKDKNGDKDQPDEVLGLARSVKGVEVVVLFKQANEKKETRVNLRSKGKIDVNKIAAAFGGGGHKTASGCTLKMDLKEAKKLVLGRINKEF